MQVTAFDIAQRFVGVKEANGTTANPFILSMLQLDTNWPQDDEVPWCSAFVNYVAWILRLPRSKRLDARSWLEVGRPIPLSHDVGRICPDARIGYDVAIFKRGDSLTSGHVGFWAGQEGSSILVLGGNQSNSVMIKRYAAENLLGVRRLFDGA
jgi:uncharacterized protein (TIGR02594 family)